MDSPIRDALSPIVVAVFFGGLAIACRYSLSVMLLPFMFSNLFKAWFQENISVFERVDYTVATALLALAAGFIALVRRPQVSPQMPWLYWFLFMLLAAAMLVSTPLEYSWASREYLQFTGFGAVAVTAPAMLFRSEQDMKIFLRTLLFVALLVVTTTLIMPPNPNTHRKVFMTDSDSITIARLFAMGILVILSMRPQPSESGRVLYRTIVLIALAGLLMVGILLSGSRGPLLHLLICFMATIFLLHIPLSWKIVLSVAITASIGLTYSMMEDAPVLSRFSELTDIERLPEASVSISYRVSVWKSILETWNEAFFFGHGLGVIEVLKNAQPHSAMLDILYSGGFVSLFLFLAIAAVAFGSWLVRPTAHLERPSLQYDNAAFLLAVFGFVTSTSGYESAGVRYILILFSLPLCIANIRRAESQAKIIEENRKASALFSGPRRQLSHANTVVEPLRSP